MDSPYETSLLAKVIWSAGIVLCLTAVAERISTRVAGVLSGAPLSAVIIYFFVGRDMGTAYVVESVPHGVAAFSATLAFVLVYYGTSLRFPRIAPVASPFLSVAAYILIAGGLVAIPFTLTTATATTVCVMAFSIWLFRRIEFVSVATPVRYTARLILMRGGFAAGLIVGAIALAEILSPRWTGLLAGFPSTLLPTLVIIHMTYGTANTHAMIRNFPVGMGSIVLYILSVGFTFPLWGIYGGTAASLAVSFLYLTIVMLWIKARPIQQAVRTPLQ
ncbi:MAG: hypothetical protein GKS00_25640 [Alphaproteobacteria bacterium]|nr:hypothetical protein [Alphaproteobacteria bacterium]